ncbi:MAG: hypothetical protein WC455_20220 [Dehalococcoidia bacterium]|jgi:hypothetical protein
MCAFEGMSVPIHGSFLKKNEAQTTVWTVTDGGSMLMSIGSTAATVVYGLEIDIDNTTVNATDKHNLLLKQSSTKAGTTRDSFVQMELGATTAVVTSCFSVGTASVPTRPSYFLTVASTAVSANVGGFVDEVRTTARTSASPMGALACLVGTTAYFIPMFHATNTATAAAQ